MQTIQLLRPCELICSQIMTQARKTRMHQMMPKTTFPNHQITVIQSPFSLFQMVTIVSTIFLQTKVHLNLLEAEDVHEFVPKTLVEIGVEATAEAAEEAVKEAVVKWTDRTMMKIMVMRILQISMRYKTC